MKQKVLPLLLLSVLGVVLISGCTGLDPATIAKSNAMIKQFLDEHPNAKIVAVHFSENQSKTVIDQLRKDCDNPDIQDKEFYRVTITDPNTNFYAVVWIDWKTQTIECAYKIGTEGNKTIDKSPKPGCESHATYKCDSGHVYWYDSCGNKQEKKEYCSYGCSDNACLPQPTRTCTDSDGGKNYYQKGTATSSDGQNLSDICNDDFSLTEKYCSEGEIKWETYKCPAGCNDGACIQPACSEGQTKSCGSDVGICKSGIQTCTNDTWGNCTGIVSPITEICGNGLDDDCDGLVDENCQICTEGQTKPCGSNVGICRQGTQTCINGSWGSCTGSINPITEICGNGLDDDCDGAVDESCQTTDCNTLKNSSSTGQYFSMCLTNGYPGVCFNKFTGVYQGCGSENYCTINNANAQQNIWCKAENQTCTDSDGGINYYVRGTITFGSTSQTDTCTYCIGDADNPSTPPSCEAVVEYYCDGNSIKSETYKCPSGYCSDGACIQQPQCTNECPVSGSRQCSGTNSYQMCGNYDSDSCLEWSQSYACVQSQVTGGIDLSTGSAKIYLGDTLTKSGLRTTLTKTELPELLAQGTFYDDTGTSYVYNQYIQMTGGTLKFGTSGGDLTDPELYIDTGVSTYQPLYKTSVIFNRLLNLSSPDVRDQSITLFGKSYFISSESGFDQLTQKLALFGDGVTQIITEGQTVTMTLGGVDHLVKIIDVSNTTQAVISIDGVTQTVTKGQIKIIAGISVLAKDIYYFSKPDQFQVELILQVNKIVLEHGAAVKVGQTEDTIDGTLVTLTGTPNQGISKLEISVTAMDSAHDSIVEGSAFTDPIFGFKMAFGGLKKGTVDTITIDNAGTVSSSLKFTDYRGYERMIIWAYSATSYFSPMLNDSSTRTYHVLEGEAIAKNDYVLVAPSQEYSYGHVLQYSAASSLGNPGGYVEFKDVFSSDTVRVYLIDPGYLSGTFYLDGNPYYLKVLSPATQKIQITWDSGASAGSTGSDIMVFPLIKTKGGAYVTLIKNQVLPGTGMYQFPGYTGTFGVTSSTTSIAAGRLTYTLSGGSTPTITAINGISLSASPVVLIYEQSGKSLAGSDVNDAIIATVGDGSGAGVDMTILPPTLTAATYYSGMQQTDSSVSEYYDRYGTHISYDSDAQGLMVVEYPEFQAEGMVAVGSDPTFSITGMCSAGQCI